MKTKSLLVVIPMLLLAGCSNGKSIDSEAAQEIVNNFNADFELTSLKGEMTSTQNMNVTAGDLLSMSISSSAEQEVLFDTSDVENVYYYMNTTSSSSQSMNGSSESVDATYAEELSVSGDGYKLEVLTDGEYSSMDLGASDVELLLPDILTQTGALILDPAANEDYIINLMADTPEGVVFKFSTSGNDLTIEMSGELSGDALYDGSDTPTDIPVDMSGVLIDFSYNMHFDENGCLTSSTQTMSLDNQTIEVDLGTGAMDVTIDMTMENSMNYEFNVSIDHSDRITA